MWLLSEDVARELRARCKGLQISADTRAKFTEHLESQKWKPAAGPRNLTIAGTTAEIAVDGVLTEKADIIMWIFGLPNTTYESIRASLAQADANPDVKNIVLKVSSPGGLIDGLFETLAAIQATQKPIAVRASRATSAAYAIAAVAGPISAASAASEFGSVGVVTSIFLEEDVIEITSTEAPNKRPDPKTTEGQAVIREHLDAIHDLFVGAIADGRTTTKKAVNETYGRGGVLLAGEAKERGMIDRVQKQPAKARAQDDAIPAALVDGYNELVAVARIPRARATAQQDASADPGGAAKPKDGPMTKEEMKAQHPELYAAAVAEGETAGVAKERKRVGAHLKLAKSTGATDVAYKAIESGASTLDEDVHADYMSAAINRRDQNARQADSDAAGAVVDGAVTAQAAGTAPKPPEASGSLVDLFASDLPPKKKTG